MTSTEEAVLRADVCVAGAGIAGLNALHVASRYLRPGQRIVLVDRRDRVGGMWVDTYDHVRLHQPHQFFTAGDVRWTSGMPPEHLASKGEVLEHLRHCLDEVGRRVDLVELFGHSVECADEGEESVTVTCRAPDDTTVRVVADHFINAVGLQIEANQPLPLTSDRVRSVSPETCDLAAGPIAQDDAPVWVVGSGKTGMDALHALVTSRPGREVNLLAGTGTFFVDRDLFYPTRARRWWSGRRPNSLLTSLADRFDGTNEAEMWAWCRDQYGVSVMPDAAHCFIGLISPAEIATIRAGLNEVVRDHLVDAVDAADGTDGARLSLRSGGHLDVPAGSWIVNCTSHFAFKGRPSEPPYVSEGGRVVHVGASGLFGFSSFAGYFLTHLLMLGKLREAPLWAVDGVPLFQASSSAGVAAALVLAQHNLGVVLDAVPTRVFSECGLDFDRWYPLPRRLVGQVAFAATHKRKREQYQRALKRVGERFGIDVGPVVPAAKAPHQAAI